jgi:hypothetical protein
MRGKKVRRKTLDGRRSGRIFAAECAAGEGIRHLPQRHEPAKAGEKVKRGGRAQRANALDALLREEGV